MKPLRLLPHRIQNLGYLFLFVGIIMIVALSIKEDLFEINIYVPTLVSQGELLFSSVYFEISEHNVNYTLTSLLIVIGGLLVAFSKEKIEDEFIQSIRLKSFQLAILINYLLVLFALFFIYDFFYLYFLLLNVYTPLLIYIILFRINIYKAQIKNHEE